MANKITKLAPANDPGELGAVYHQRFAVEYDYPVHFTQDLFARDNEVFVDARARKEPNKRHRFVVFIDADVAASWPALMHDIGAYSEHHAERLLLAQPEIIPGGEQVKRDPELVTRLQRRLLDLGIDRHCYVVAIGGGAFLDMVGFVAATTHRGVRHVRVPTTVLGQNDSGVGVKNGVNAFGVKNLLGTFAPPFAVLNDASFCARCIRAIASPASPRRSRSLIRDGVFFEWLESQVDALRACVPEQPRA
jgi:3-dehydroquinate synthase